MNIESNPYLSLNCFWELKLNLVRVCLCYQQAYFRGDDLGLLWVTMFTPMCKLWPVDQTGNVLGWKLPVISHSCENEASYCYSPFWHILPVSQGLQAKRLKELHWRYSKETAALFANDAVLSRWMVGLKKQGWDSGLFSKESGERVKWKGILKRWMTCILFVLRAADLYLKHMVCVKVTPKEDQILGKVWSKSSKI